MNKWDEIKKVTVFESDDFQNKFDRNGLNFLFYWKAKYPKLKISLFTIPNKTTPEFIELLKPHFDWIELLVHGWDHDSNFECYGWDYDKTKTLMNRIKEPYKKFFKSPGWTITPDLCGYPAAPEDPINKDKQAVYKALRDLDFVVVDRHYNRERRLEDGKYICIDCNDIITHSHTWNMMTPDENSRNGFEQVETRGVPWDNDTVFYTIGQAWEEGLILPCQS